MQRFSPKILTGSAAVAAMLWAASVDAAPKTHNIAAGDSAAFNSLLVNKTGPAGTLELGDTIVLQANSVYTGSFTLPEVNVGTGYITIRSSNLAQLPPDGQRVFPADAPDMPKIRTSDSASSTKAMKTAARAHHYKLIGLEFIAMQNVPASPSNYQTTIVEFGNDAHTSLTDVPHDIIMDRCIVRASNTSQKVRHGVQLHSASTDVINSYIYDIKESSTDATGIGGYNGPGPFNIINNYIEAAAESIIFGGGTPMITNMVPSDIVVSKNHLTKNPNWIGTTSGWLIKNHFELKAGRRVTVDGNLMNLSWNGAGGQSGKAITFKCIQTSGQGASWTATEDVTVSNNLVYDCGIGVAFGGSKGPTGATINGWPKDVTIRNNLFHNVKSGTITGPIGSSTWGSGYYIQVIEGPENITFDHNTAFATVGVATIDGAQSSGFVYTNNMNHKGTYSFKGGGTGASSNACFNTFMPTIQYRQNVVMGATASSFGAVSPFPAYWADWNAAPYSNHLLAFPTAWTNVLVNQASPGTNFAGYKVVGWNQPTNITTYPYNNTGTDGKDIGCDIDALNTATAGCITGVWSAPPVNVTLKNGVNGYSGATSFYVSGSSPTSNFGPARSYMTANALSGTNGSVQRMFYKFDVSSIPSGATIDSATLRLKTEFVSSTSNNGISIYRMAPVGGAFTVNYATATRNTYNGTNSWTGGANAAGDVANSNNDYIDTPVSSIAIPVAGQFMQFNVTSSVQAWVSGTANNGWLIYPAFGPGGSNVSVRTGTPADTAGSGDYPELVITYH